MAEAPRDAPPPRSYCPATGKVRHPSPHVAAKALRRLEGAGHRERGNVYRCRHCHDWHCSHQTRAQYEGEGFARYGKPRRCRK